MNRTDLDRTRAIHGAVAAVIVAATFNAAAGTAQALPGADNTADAIAETAEPAGIRTLPASITSGRAEDAAGAVTAVPGRVITTLPAETPAAITPPGETPGTFTTRPAWAVSAVTTASAPAAQAAQPAQAIEAAHGAHAAYGAYAAYMAQVTQAAGTAPTAHTANTANAANTANGTNTANTAYVANTANPSYAAGTAGAPPALAPPAPAGASVLRPAWTPARPIWTRAGMVRLPMAPSRPMKAQARSRSAAKSAARTRARASAKKAGAARRAPYRVHHRVWRTSARPAARVWAPRTPKGRNKAIAYRLVTQRSWPVTQFQCLDNLWTRESNWNHRAQNPSSGAYGIPQALPGAKMVGVGHDWRVNPATQIRWGLKYIRGRYGSPCGAWGHFQSHNWY
jgi:hypothetical protein